MSVYQISPDLLMKIDFNLSVFKKAWTDNTAWHCPGPWFHDSMEQNEKWSLNNDEMVAFA